MVTWSPFVLALLAGAGVTAIGATLAWLKRSEPGGRPLVVFQLALTAGGLCYALDILLIDRTLQMTLAGGWLLAQAVTATTWLYVALEYAGRNRWTTRRTAALLAVEPTAFAVVLAVPPLRQYLLTFPPSATTGSIVYNPAFEQGPLFLVHFLVLVLVMLSGSIVFVQLFVRARNLYRTQATAVVVAALAPWSTVLVQSLGFVPDSDPSIFAWMIAGIALTGGLYEFKTLDPVPAAHETIVETMGDGVLVLDVDDRISDANPAARSFLGLEESELIGDHVRTVVPDWDSLAGPETEATDWRNLTLERGEDVRFLDVRRSTFEDHHDRVVGQLVELRDVTARERRERELARFKTIFDTVRDRVYVLDADDRFVMVNDSFANALGYDPEDLIGEPFDIVLAPGSQSLAPASDGPVELTLATDGGAVPVETVRAPIEFESVGVEGGVVGVVRDITRRKRIEADLAATTERYETLIEASPLSIIATDRTGVVERWNPAAEETFGWSAEETVGEQLPIASEEERERVATVRERVLDGERITNLDMVLRRADGSRFDASVSVAPIADQAGETDGAVIVVADISQRVEREQQLHRQNERLEEFASVVSHDLRNPLEVARGNLELATDGEPDRLERVDNALARMDGLIDELLTLAREGRSIDEPEPISVESVAQTAWQTVDTDDASLVVADAPTVEADPGRLSELFENLFRNAVEHGPSNRDDTSTPADPDGTNDSGTVTVTVGGLRDGFYVEDDGPGIPEGDRSAVFEVGYTTAADGTGFGLSIVETIAEAHGWAVSLTDGTDGGARFEFTTGPHAADAAGTDNR